MKESEVVKVAKKALKKSDQMKIKVLAKLVVEKMEGNQDVSTKEVKKIIQESKKFVVNGKVVELSKKRIVTPTTTENDSSKRQKKETSADSKAESSRISKWREENKIIVMSCSSENGETRDSDLQSDPSIFPFTSFDSQSCTESVAPGLIQQCVSGNGFKRPSPIQAQAWPILTSQCGGRRRDMVGIAETGSGKTLAFAIPALTLLASQNARVNRRMPRMLVLSPTRELAMQSDDVIKEFGAVLGLKSQVMYGGTPKWEQKEALKKGVDCVVATPGRIKDLIDERACNLGSVNYLVLDEADRMLVSEG